MGKKGNGKTKKNQVSEFPLIIFLLFVFSFTFCPWKFHMSNIFNLGPTIQGNYPHNRQGNPLNRWPTMPSNGFMHPASMTHAIPMNIPNSHRYGWPVMPHVMLSQQPADQIYQPMVSMAAGPMVPGSAPIPIPVLGQYREPWTGNGSALPAVMPMQIDHNLSKDNGVRLPPSGGPGTFPPFYAGAQECYQGFSSQVCIDRFHTTAFGLCKKKKKKSY
jgi:hypothetical protein